MMRNVVVRGRPGAAALAALCAAAAVCLPARAQFMGFDPGPQVTFQEEVSRFLPGVYYFQKGLDYYKKQQIPAAIQAWETAAGWAMKDAQYNLGLLYYKGDGVPQDRPRGLAWLALAAERKNPALQSSLAAAWDEASEAEHNGANAIWRDLRKQYGDEVALPRARKRFETELGQMSGSRAGSGNARIVSRSMGNMDSKTYRERLEALAEQNFGAGSGSSEDAGPAVPDSGTDAH